VVETENERAARRITLRHCLKALANQTYPRALTQVIVVDSGEIPGLRALVREVLPAASVLDGNGLGEYEMKNAGARLAAGEIVAYSDGDCVPARDWLEQAVETLQAAPSRVVGVQGQTTLAAGLFSRQVSVLLYGLRTDASGRICRRIVSDNCAFRADFIRRVPFEPATLSSSPETVLWARMTAMAREMRVNSDMRSTHDYPVTRGLRGLAAMLAFFLQRAYGNGYCMTRVRTLVPGLRAGWTRWLGPLGPPVLVGGKALADLEQIARSSPGFRLAWWEWIAFAPLYAAYYLCHLAGGYAALLGIPAPRF
jgi:glycosyltransferase involved in cell wall biosynthesis